ncbi:MAG: AMIN domain-containing protein [Proteobacteria bacterium]|nr:AMIN domain-containing protein [Pseudomonadota bacterium]
MQQHTILMFSLIVILLCGVGCAHPPGAPYPEQDTGSAALDPEALLHLQRDLGEQVADLQHQRARILDNDADNDAPAHLGRLDRALETLRSRQRQVRIRLQQLGLFPNELRYAVASPAAPIPDATTGQTVPSATAPLTPSVPKALGQSPRPEPMPMVSKPSEAPSAGPRPRTVPGMPEPATPATLTGISWIDDGPALSLYLATSAPNPRFKTFTLPAPSRIVVDITSMQRPAPPALHLALSSPHARSIRMGWHPEHSSIRVVIDCSGQIPPYSVLSTAQGITVRLTR